MEDPDRPGDHACPHTLVTSIPDGIHKHKHTHNVNRWIEAKDVPGGMSWALKI